MLCKWGIPISLVYYLDFSHQCRANYRILSHHLVAWLMLLLTSWFLCAKWIVICCLFLLTLPTFSFHSWLLTIYSLSSSLKQLYSLLEEPTNPACPPQPHTCVPGVQEKLPSSCLNLPSVFSSSDYFAGHCPIGCGTSYTLQDLQPLWRELQPGFGMHLS